MRKAIVASVTAAFLLGTTPAASASSVIPGADQLSSQVSIPLPGAVLPGNSVENRLAGATRAHLNDMGHGESLTAVATAHAWVFEAATGGVAFYGNAGNGTSSVNERSNGNVYRFTAKEAEERIKWLSRDANRTPHAQDAGVAVLRHGDTIYLAEVFEG